MTSVQDILYIFPHLSLGLISLCSLFMSEVSSLCGLPETQENNKCQLQLFRLYRIRGNGHLTLDGRSFKASLQRKAEAARLDENATIIVNQLSSRVETETVTEIKERAKSATRLWLV